MIMLLCRLRDPPPFFLLQFSIVNTEAFVRSFDRSSGSVSLLLNWNSEEQCASVSYS